MFAAKDALLTRPSGGYVIPRSLRFRSSASAYLNRTFGTPTNANKCSFSFWHKRGNLGSTNVDVLATSSTDNEIAFGANATADTIGIYMGAAWRLVSTQLFRDPSAWYHFLVVIDVANATAAQKLRVYVNGVEITTWTTDTRSGLTTGSSVINTAVAHRIASYDGSINFCDGYFAETNFIDGQALTPTSFGATNATTGVWAPIQYTGTYGANGFHLDFNSYATTAALGTDTSGNGNTWTVNNVSVTAGVTYDSMIDVPTVGTTGSNYPTLNPLAINAAVTLSKGNLHMAQGVSSYPAWATMSSPSGKFYFEMTAGATVGANGPIIGIGSYPASIANSQIGDGTVANQIGYWSTGVIKQNGATLATIAAFTANQTVACAYDCATGKVWFANGSGTFDGDPVAGTGNRGTVTGEMLAGISNAAVAQEIDVNFGQRPFTYTPPSGYSALNTYNLPTPTILKGNTVMDATLYTGTGASLSVTNAAGFQPDLVWVKGRSGATDHAWYDSVRGVQKQIESNTTTAETTETTGLTAFGSTGFTVGALAQMNTSAATYVAWQWKGSGTTVSNTTGSITSTVCVNPTAGFSVFTYTGTGANATVGHGIGVAPSMVIIKARGAADWYVGHTSLGFGNTGYFIFNNTGASGQYGSLSIWQATAPSSSVVTLGTAGGVNTVSQGYIAYCFAPIASYSSFGSYTGNGSTDGPFVFTGFRPRWLMVKQTAIGNWFILDSSRNTYNVTNTRLIAEGPAADDTGSAYDVDFLSNGFKLRSTSNVNVSAAYIYIAFAESPFKNSLAR